MVIPKLKTVGSANNLGDRVDRFFREPGNNPKTENQLSMGFPHHFSDERKVDWPSRNVASFLDFISDAVPDGDVYLFGGVLRDLALLGRKGFNSDIDLVVEGNWSNVVSYIHSLNAHKNKFGGYRLQVGGWPIDIWSAKDTWAIKQGLVTYNGIASLTDTTVLNWDAILMNWRTRNFIYRTNYFEQIKDRVLDVVLLENPSPLGMAVRVFRHFCLKDAKKITASAATYMARCAKTFSFQEIKDAEFKSYRNNVIQRPIYSFFKNINTSDDLDIKHQFSIATNIVAQDLGLI
jgi:hypothetical protein